MELVVEVQIVLNLLLVVGGVKPFTFLEERPARLGFSSPSHNMILIRTRGF